MKYFVICAFAALVLLQAASGFKRVVYVMPVTTTNTTTTTTTNTPSTSTNSTSSANSTSTTNTTTTVVTQNIVYCSWKNNWCRPTSNTTRVCKWGICKLFG
ncbi:integumentary mucin C.1 [Drosophila subpulchrella]|uniref:integumentary mucin C.1 n=1 Tax=Drosophila subpulchrella TaxID=1486046 RepID=UPI0018A1AC39|nr:integumentary mucin C.1 [Drosophila subpulchrella]